MSTPSTYQDNLAAAIRTFESLKDLAAALEQASRLCMQALQAGHKLLLCGNGGSAAQAQHLAGELMGRYKVYREGLAAVALPADSALVSCIGNDFGYEDVFARQVRALGKPGDILIVFTTSGTSPNVLRSLEAARDTGIGSIAFLGGDGGKARALADCPVVVAERDTPRVQEAHHFLMHSLVEQIENGLRPPDVR